ncbi:MAG: CoA pyrophosphatase, partial [Bacillota bacterium]|nr:CoA pyrophosphatase [Bacillota bacterium]
VIIGKGEELPSLLYEVRGSKLDRQPGEICFPGGLIEDDEYPEECALRETWEEIGIPKEEIEIIAKFDSVLSTSGSQLHSYIGLIRETSLEKLKPNECEVEEVFTVPVSTLISTEPEVYTNKLVQSPDENFPYERVTGGKMYPWRGGHSPVPVYEIQDRIIWGLTARLTKQFIEVLREGR